MSYIEKRIKDGVEGYRTEVLPDSMLFEGEPTTQAPAGAQVARIASRVAKPYQPEAIKRTLNTSQFGQIEPQAIFRTSCDFRPAEYSHEVWRKLGFNMLSKFTSDQQGGTNKWQDVPDNQRFDNETESSLHGPYESNLYYERPLSEIESYYNSSIPAYGPGTVWAANIETSNFWSRNYYKNSDGSGGISHYPTWDSAKNNVIQMESQGGQMTVEQLFSNPGLQQQEAAVRRANRISIMLLHAKKNGAFVCYGSSIYQGDPKTNALTTSGRFRDEGDANVTYLGGVNGTITLNGRTYTGLTGSFYKHETAHLSYYYNFIFQYTGLTPYDQVPDCASLYPYVYNRHVIAAEVGHWLANRKRLIDIHGGNGIPQIRQHELHYEGDGGNGADRARVPSAFNAPNGDGGGSKVWLPPYHMRAMRMLAHFLEGERDGAGMHIFHSAGAPNQGIEYNLSSNPRWNFHLHTLSALMAAGRDMEQILDKIAGSTLTTDIDIKVGGVGNFETVNGVIAYAMGPDGGQGTMKPCFVTRHKTTTAGTSIVLMGGMDQDWSTTRIDIISIPGVGSGNTIKLTYKGRDLQVFEVFFPAGVSNTEFLAKSIVSQWEKPGYGGRITQ